MQTPEITPAGPARRTVLGAAAWGGAAVSVAAAAPALAASTTPGLADLSIEILDPTMDFATWQYVEDQPVYTYGTNTVRFMAAAPAAMVVTNNGPGAAVNPTGTLDTVMWNYDYDAQSTSLNYTLVSSTDPQVSFTPYRRPTRTWTWTYAGTLAPGESLTIPLRYEVGSALGQLMTGAFSQYRYNLFMSATVTDLVTGDTNDLSEKVGYFDGTHNLLPEY
ncbi:hypothetical protein [Micrococcus sp.]|uniref:hypothetical protein n=1 Tax=Micrococcus sp. TaxID=1271 RepID=UPI002A913704|nr:hypothetical protein [Micrococcus sp.]MDY6054848.1 hypothetical protein [Micrococcus sp.]